MSRTTHKVEQGSQAWHDLRAQHFTASEAPAMLGVSKYQTRNELLAQKKFGVAKPVSEYQEALFARGHAAEAQARALIEADVLDGEMLFPVTMTYGELLASLDGLDLFGETAFEHKLLNEELAIQIAIGELEPHYWAQLEQVLYVSGAKRAIFAISDGTRENLQWLEYRPVPGRIEQILAGWEQFKADMAVFELAEEAPKPNGTAVMELPSLFVQIAGEVKASNLPAYRDAAMARIESIKTDLATDQDFADAEAIIKWADKAEKELASVKKQAQGQAVSIDEVFRTIDHISDALRQKRLLLEKLVKTEKESRKREIVVAAGNAFQAHITANDARFAPFGLRVQVPSPDFATAIKGKRTLSSVQNAVDTELARAKVDAANIINTMTVNVEQWLELVKGGHEMLFPDLQAIITKDRDDFALLVRSRIERHEAQQAEAKAKIEEMARRSKEAERAREAALAEICPAHPGPAYPPPARSADMARAGDGQRATPGEAGEVARTNKRILDLYHSMEAELTPFTREGLALHFGRAVLAHFANDNSTGVSVAS